MLKIIKNKFKLSIIFTLSLLLVCFTAESKQTTLVMADTIIAASCSYPDVSTAIDLVNDGGTVLVPEGNCTWDNQLVITKGIYLIGAGSENTIIKSNYTAGSDLIEYTPTDWDGNWPFRISGFTFDLDNKSGGIYFNYKPGNTNFTIQTKLIIDNNVFKNSNLQALTINGYYGVAYNNLFTDIPYPVRFASGDSENWWNNWEGIVFGKADNNFYFEDNTFNIYEILVDCQYGNRYAFRYNTITATKPSGSYPLCDMHGNAGQYWSCFGGEIYGNNITVQGDGGQILDQRGGKAAVFYNKVNGKNVGIKMREEFCDEENPDTNPQPQHVSDSYNWCNYKTLNTYGIFTAYEAQNSCETYEIKENKDWWNYNPNYNGSTPGVGCGSSLPNQCTVGDGFWLTTQSCSDLNDHIGPNPITPISGALYKCTSTDTWELYYTPYIYPHPLREDTTITNTNPPTCSNPDNFTLQQNYPNPFNPSTTIKYSVVKPCNVQIKIYNHLGQEVYALVNKQMSAGEHSVIWNGKDAKGNKLANGIYYYRLTAGKQVGTKKCYICDRISE